MPRSNDNNNEATLLMEVERVFLLEGRGVRVLPGPPLDGPFACGRLHVELRLPDGGSRPATLELSIEMISYDLAYLQSLSEPPIRRWATILHGVEPDDVPIGTQIWCRDATPIEEPAEVPDPLPDEGSAGTACPYCGFRLRTDLARQCFHCGMAWHDPANPRKLGSK